MSIRFLWHRITNLLRAAFSYALSLIGIVRVHHGPTFVSIEPANFCQLHCPECPVGQRDSKSSQHTILALDSFKHILEQVQAYCHTIQFFFQGEPLLNPNLPQMIALAHQRGIYTIVSTNAQLLTPLMAQQLLEAGLSRIIVSIDGMSEDSYRAYRVGGSLHKALDGLTFLRQAKDQLHARTHIELQVLRLRSNEHEWKAMKRQYQTMGADSLTFKTAQLYDYKHGNSLMPTNARYSRYTRQKDGTYNLKHPHTHSCHRLWTGAVITTTGELLPCCFDKAKQFSYGNVFEQPLITLYQSEKANHFRRQLLQSKFNLSICQNC